MTSGAQEGFFHYRQYSATELAAAGDHSRMSGSFSSTANCPTRSPPGRSGPRSAALRGIPDGLARMLPALAPTGTPLDVLRTAVSVLGAELGWRPTLDIDHGELRSQSLRLCAVVPTLLTAVYRLQQGKEPVPPRDDLGYAANYLWMLLGHEAPADHVRAIEQYLMLTIDHGFNASTFAARVIASTGADLAASVVGAIGALSGPLHGGAPSRALAMLDSIGTPDRAEQWIRDAVLAVTASWDSATASTRPTIRVLCSCGMWLGASAATWSNSPSRWSGPRSTYWPSSSPVASSTPMSSSSPAWSCTPAEYPARCSPRPSPPAAPSAGPPTSWSRLTTTA